MAEKSQATTWHDNHREKEFLGSFEDRPEDRTVSSRAHLRNELSEQVQAFLSGGGQINEVEPLRRADPPRKPTGNYGGRPI